MAAGALSAYLVEDSPAVREGLIETLAELADIQTVGTAANVRDAIAWLENPAHHWDIAIIDLILEHGGSGLEVLRALRQRPATRQVVVLTATASPAVREQCLALGCDGVFDKAIETDALIDWCVRLGRPATI